MEDVTIYIRDRNDNIKLIVEEFVRLNTVSVFNDIGNWRLDLLRGSEEENLITATDRIEVLVYGDPLFTGPVKRIHAIDSTVDRSTIVTGVDDNWYLSTRLALPVHDGPPFTASMYDSIEDTFETAAKYFVSHNAGPDAPSWRQIPGLTIQADYGRGAVKLFKARFDQLDEFLREMADRCGGVGFNVLSKQFQVYETVDRSANVLYSYDLETMTKYELSQEVPDANAILVGGGGEGVDRTTAWAQDSQSIVDYGRIEKFYNRSEYTDTEDLVSAGEGELAKRADLTELSITPASSSGNVFRWKQDYFLGDVVLSRNQYGTFVAPVQEVHINASPQNGLEIKPFVGTVRARGLKIFSRARTTKSRLDLLETRQ